jgi:hypothetical protein
LLWMFCTIICCRNKCSSKWNERKWSEVVFIVHTFASFDYSTNTLLWWCVSCLVVARAISASPGFKGSEDSH